MDVQLRALLAELQAETNGLLHSGKHVLVWQVDAPESLRLTSPLQDLVRSVVRKAVSDMLAHVAVTAAVVMIFAEGGELRLIVSDDGIAQSPSADADDYVAIRLQVNELGGRVAVRTGESGTIVTMSLPVAAAG